MSKNIVIQENGSAQTLNSISYIDTNGVDWVPEDETVLGTLSVNKNGTYKAEDSGLNLYAFSLVEVKCPTGKVAGKKNGQYVVITTDGDGNLVEYGLPTYISVVTPPDKTAYVDGEAISINGIAVKAYFSDDSEYGAVNPSDLTFSPAVADVSGSGVVYVRWNRCGDGAVLEASYNITVDQS